MNAGDVFDLLEQQARRRGRSPALVAPDAEVLSYAALWSRIERAAAGLRRSGLAPGDRVLFAVRPGPAAFVLILAIVRAGGVVVALDLGAGEQVFRQRMALVRPRWVVAESTLFALSHFALLRAVLRRRGLDLPHLAGLPDCRFVRVGCWLPGAPAARAIRPHGRKLPALTYQALCAGEPAARPPRLDGEAPVFMVFTSGTTDAPRVVVHSSRSIGATLALAAEHLALTSADRVYSSELHVVLPALLCGATCIVPRSRRFSARRALHDLVRYRVTCASGIPAEFQQVLEELERRGQTLPCGLRTVLLGAAPVHAPFLARLQPYLDPETAVWCVYGATEMLPVCSVLLSDKIAYRGDGDLVGRPFPGVSVRIDPAGELCVRGPNLCTGYLDGAPLDELRTGDLARLTEDGQVVLLGRSKDMIIRGHQNIYPELIEPVVGSIAGVRRCALVGVPSPSGADELVVLVVEPAPGLDRRVLRRRIKRQISEGPRRIDSAARPDRILIMALPLAGRSRKVDKVRLRAALQERLLCASR